MTLDYEPVAADSNWTIGTLTYSKRGLVVLFAWLLGGDFAWNMKERAINPIAQLLLRGMTAPDWLVGLLIGSIPSAIGLFLSPLASVKSDRHRGPWGRRIPFILIPTPFIVLMMVGLAFSPQLGDWVHRHLGALTHSQAVCRIGVFALFWTALEIATIIANSLVGALINDVVPHRLIGRFFGLFRVVGLTAGIVFNHYLMGKAETHYRVLLISLALLYAAGFILMCLNVREGQYPPPPPPRDTQFGRFAPLISYLKECFSKPYYLWFFAATTLGNLSIAPINTFSVFHAHSVGMSNGTYGDCIALSYVFSLLLAYPLGICADRLHPLRMAILFSAMYCAVTGFGFFYAVTSAHFFIALLLHTVISGCYITGTASIAQRMLPRSKFAEFSSAGGIVGSISFFLFPPGLGLLIQYLHHDYKYVFILASSLAAMSMASYIVLLHYHRLNKIPLNED